MADYPQNVAEFRDWFATESACREYLARLRWAPGPVLPRLRQHCGVAHEDTVFYRLMEQAVALEPVRGQDRIGGRPLKPTATYSV
jgi:hypothetical protein